MKLMLVDDHSIFLEGLQYLLEAHGIEIVGVAQDGQEAIEKARDLKPDIILMDIKMPKCSGVDALRYIKAEKPEIKIVMLTTSDEDEDIFKALKYGASGYLQKNTSAVELIKMLSDLEKGENLISSEMAATVLKEFKVKTDYVKLPDSQTELSNDTKLEEHILTDRQVEVLELVAKGFTYKEVGETLGLAERTIKYHMGKIIERLHYENKAQVIAYAARHGLTEADD